MCRERPDDRCVSEFIAGVSFAGDILSEAKDLAEAYGAEEGTRTPTPLRVHGPEPCASANSATSASGCEPEMRLAIGKHDYCKGGIGELAIRRSAFRRSLFAFRFSLFAFRQNRRIGNSALRLG